MLKVGTIGIGNAGNQVADLAMRMYNIPGLAINSSQKDLMNVSEKVLKVIVGDSLGSGKDRDEAKGFIKKYIAEFMKSQDVVKFIEEYNVLFVVSSIGGGTGYLLAPIYSDVYSKLF